MQNINKDLAKTQEKFWKFYNSDLREIYQKLEPIRKKYLYIFFERFSFFSCLYLFIFILYQTGFVPESIYNNEDIFSLFSFIVLISVVYTFAPFLSYREKTKAMAMEKLLSFWGDFKYLSQKDTVYPSEVEKSELFTCYNRHNVDDAFSGKYKGTSIAVSEHELYLKGNKGDFYIFKGILISFKFNKKFNGKTVVRSKSRWINIFFNNPFFTLLLGIPFLIFFFSLIKNHNFLDFLDFLEFVLGIVTMVGLISAFIYLCYSFKYKKKADKRVVLEGIPFLRQWNVSSDNQVEARYILTPVLMENLLKIKKLFHGKHIDFSFFDNKLLIAVHTTTDMFETTSLTTSALNYSNVREVVNQLYSIFSIIDILELENTSEQKQKNIKKSSFKQSL